MNIIKVKQRCVATNYKHENKVIYEDAYVNLDRITNVLIMGTVARLIFSGLDRDYIELDTEEWNMIYNAYIQPPSPEGL